MLKYAVVKGYAAVKGQRKRQVKEMPNVKRRIQLLIPVEDEDKRENSAVTGELKQDSGERTSGRSLSQIENKHAQIEVEKGVLRAFRALFNGFEEQWYNTMQQESVDSESEAEEPQCDPVVRAVEIQSPL